MAKTLVAAAEILAAKAETLVTPQGQLCTKLFAANVKQSARYLLSPAAVNLFFAGTALKAKEILVQKDPSATNDHLVNALLKNEAQKEELKA